jgi:hypothetical protein
MNRPNLFHFATSELSQDAFLAWLLSWAHPAQARHDQNLHECGTALLHRFFDCHNLSLPAISTVRCSTQKNRIDVQCEINGTYVVLIEDKTCTEDHSDQLRRYRQHLIDEGYKEEAIVAIYYKTEDQSSFDRIEKAGFRHFSRDEMLSVLNEYSGNNEILVGYREHLQGISEVYESYHTKPVIKWSDRGLRGFYGHLQESLDSGKWRRVPNRRGGFWAFTFANQSNGKQEWYVQIEAYPGKMDIVVKVWIGLETEKLLKSDKRSAQNAITRIRDRFSKRIQNQLNEEGYVAKKPKRYASGVHMTVAVIGADFPVMDQSGIVDLQRTVDLLKELGDSLRMEIGPI